MYCRCFCCILACCIDILCSRRRAICLFRFLRLSKIVWIYQCLSLHIHTCSYLSNLWFSRSNVNNITIFVCNTMLNVLWQCSYNCFAHKIIGALKLRYSYQFFIWKLIWNNSKYCFPLFETKAWTGNLEGPASTFQLISFLTFTKIFCKRILYCMKNS